MAQQSCAWLWSFRFLLISSKPSFAEERSPLLASDCWSCRTRFAACPADPAISSARLRLLPSPSLLESTGENGEETSSASADLGFHRLGSSGVSGMCAPRQNSLVEVIGQAELLELTSRGFAHLGYFIQRLADHLVSFVGTIQIHRGSGFFGANC